VPEDCARRIHAKGDKMRGLLALFGFAGGYGRQGRELGPSELFAWEAEARGNGGRRGGGQAKKKEWRWQ
jgi:hypothetical protein